MNIRGFQHASTHVPPFWHKAEVQTGLFPPWVKMGRMVKRTFILLWGETYHDNTLLGWNIFLFLELTFLFQNEYRSLIFSKFWVGMNLSLSCFPSNFVSGVYRATILSLFEKIIFTRDFLLENRHFMTSIVSITKFSRMSGSFISKTALICGLIGCSMSKLFDFTCPIIST